MSPRGSIPPKSKLDINERYKVLRLYRAQYSQAKRARRSQFWMNWNSSPVWIARPHPSFARSLCAPKAS
jgi:hypothetical protein